jgi:hypothetical protein
MAGSEKLWDYAIQKSFEGRTTTTTTTTTTTSSKQSKK